MKIEDTYSYKGWIVSDNFIKRSLATLGYFFIGYLLICVAIGVLAFTYGLINGIANS